MLKCSVSYLIFKLVIIYNVLFIGLRIKWFGFSFIFPPTWLLLLSFLPCRSYNRFFFFSPYFPFLIPPVYGWILDLPQKTPVIKHKLMVKLLVPIFHKP